MSAPRSDGLVLVVPDGPVLQVLAAGPGTLVQDAGRTGWAAAGVGHAGPADRVAAGQALTLVGAAGTGDALLEVLLGGLKLAVHGGPVLLAVTGARVAVTVDDRPVPFGAPVAVPPGAVIELGRPRDGACRSYLAVAGGLQVVRVLGSASTDTLSGLGPAAVAAGTQLAIGPACLGWLPGRVRRVAPRQVPDPVLLRLLPGPRHGWFTDDVRQRLADGVWTVGPASSRVGLRLAGPELPRRCDDELPSKGLVRGALQVPPGGDLVLFGPDHPVTGGYPWWASSTRPRPTWPDSCRWGTGSDSCPPTRLTGAGRLTGCCPPTSSPSRARRSRSPLSRACRSRSPLSRACRSRAARSRAAAADPFRCWPAPTGGPGSRPTRTGSTD